MNNMLDFVKKRLPRSGKGLQALSEATGVPFKTAEKIARGYTRNPRIETLQALYDHYRPDQTEETAA